MFGKRSTASDLLLDRPAKAAERPAADKAAPAAASAPPPRGVRAGPSPSAGRARPTNITT